MPDENVTINTRAEIQTLLTDLKTTVADLVGNQSRKIKDQEENQ